MVQPSLALIRMLNFTKRALIAAIFLPVCASSFPFSTSFRTDYTTPRVLFLMFDVLVQTEKSFQRECNLS